MSISLTPVGRLAPGLAVALSICLAAASGIPAESPSDAVVEEPLPTESAGPLALKDALALALLRNPELESFSWDIRVGEARRIQASKFPNPELDLRYYDLGIEQKNLDPDDSRGRVMVNQTFELGGKRRRRVELARVEEELTAWDFETKRNEVMTQVTVEFVEILGAQRRVESLREFVEFLDLTRDRVSALAEAGIMPSMEMHQVVRRAGLGRIELQRAESGLSIARFRLAATWASRSPLFTAAVGDLEQSKLVPEIEKLIENAQYSPLLARWETELDRSEAALALAKATRVPDFTLGAGVRWEESLNYNDVIVDLEIALPIFDRKQGDIQEARHEIAKVEADRKAAEVASGEALAEFYYRLKESEARAATLGSEVVPAARAALAGHEMRFEEQPDNSDDLLDARRDLVRAEVEYTDALVDYHRALATLEGILGHGLPTVD